MKLVIVESPAKAKTINKYLGSDYKVLASYGHVRDLPPKDGSVLPDEDFAMSWTVDSRSKPRLADITKAARAADGLILATDPDREGEAISWHVLQALNEKKALKDKPVERVVFNAITRKSILDAMERPREIDGPLVEAYLARRALDYLVGFNLSPVLWRKLPGARSAGRVQSVALRLVCERENEIERFQPQEYWSILGQFKNKSKADFEARLTRFEGTKIQRLDVKAKDQADDIKSMLMRSDFTVAKVEAKPTTRNPYAPFTTSTLQQDASSKLGFSASRTMQTAQRLYEGIDLGGETVGLITYMRTDGVQIAPEAVTEAREVIGDTYGAIYLPDKPRHYSSKAKNAQEAHEAVRPTSLARLPGNVAARLDDDQRRLYDLIWKRTIASQMASAKIERTAVDIEAKSEDGRTAILRANGSVIKFDGFLSVYADTSSKKDEEDDKRLVPLSEGETVSREEITATQHFTEPPARYSEASLIKKMEELGIGRPSTYASTLATLEAREYVTIDKRRLIPQAKGRLVTAFLENFFNRYVEYGFTADLEDKLDRISAGDLVWKDVLHDFWREFSAHIAETKDLRISEVLDHLNDALGPLAFPPKEDGSNPRLCPACGEGELSLKVSRNGAFIGCNRYPDCSFTRQLGGDADSDAVALDGPKVLGVDPDSSEEITLRTGRYGPYVQRGEGKEAKRGSVPKSWDPETLDFEGALKLLSLPRKVGKHPETGDMIYARDGRYGPLVEHDTKPRKKFASVEEFDDLFTIGLNRAVDLLAEAEKKGPRRGASAALKELGEHPELGGPVTVKDGRFGPYVNHGKVNATIPKGTDPQSVDMAIAVPLLAARAEKMGAKAQIKKAPAKKAAAKKKPAAKRKAPAKKSAPKKAAAKA
ncbi:MAG: type I DNA topoisomerase [Ahrensia sp.]|nr:type I DNA topoisomerase [Ahrensia sp.]